MHHPPPPHSLLLAASDWLTFNPTKVTGLVAYGVAAAVCFLVGRKGHWVWKVLMILFAALCVDVLLGGRLWLHGLLGDRSRTEGWYRERSTTQILWIIGLGVLIILSAVMVWRASTGARKLALGAALLAIILWSLEVISLHQVDAILYKPLGTVVLVGWGWAVIAAMVVVAGLAEMASMRGSP